MTLTAAQQTSARNAAVQAARLGYAHRASIHYTQGSSRWQGIASRLRASAGHYPNYADCSAFATWCLWCALEPLGIQDIVNGQGWQAGYTGTMLNHGQVVSARDALPGDCVLYGVRGSSGAHTAIVVGPGPIVVSHGSEAGPYLLSYNYRSDVMSIRRYITSGLNPTRKATTPAKGKGKGKPKSTVKPGPAPVLHVNWFGERHNARHPDVKVWQQRMKQRGWDLAADGVYGPASARTCREFQDDKRLRVDGQVGPQTWKATWTAAVT